MSGNADARDIRGSLGGPVIDGKLGVSETIFGDHFDLGWGGKGANQAVAAARLGAKVTMLGRVGKDGFGDFLLENLQANHVNAQLVQRADASTGTATIIVDANGQNTIVLSEGANGKVSVENVENAPFVDHDLLLLQLEIPVETVLSAAARADEAARVSGGESTEEHAEVPSMEPVDASTVEPVEETGERSVEESAEARVSEPDEQSVSEGRYIPAAIRRAVWRRDRGRCTYVSPDGRPCGSRWQLELDHVHPVALGGETSMSNLRLLCRAHNQLLAEVKLGAAFMAGKREGSG